MAKLTDLMDPALSVDGDEAAAIARARAVTVEPMMVALAVTNYKRRLAGVGSKELAKDKRTARRAAHALLSAVQVVEGEKLDWNELRAQVTDEQRAAAATLDWGAWLAATAAACEQEARWLATWVIRVNLQSTIVRKLARQLHDAAVRLRGIGELHGVD